MNVTDFPDLERARQQAAEWLARLDRGLDAGERRDLRLWCAASPANARALRQVSGLWGEMDALQRLGDTLPDETSGTLETLALPEAAPPMRAPMRRRRARPALAAGIAIGLLIAGAAAWMQRGGLFAPVPDAARVLATFSTAVGEQREVGLQDGSTLAINTASQVELLRLDDNARELRLQRGEAHFTVAKDASRPFRVSVADHVVEAVGTAFDIRLHDSGAIEVAVTEGRVRLLAGDQHAGQFDMGDKLLIDAAGNVQRTRLDTYGMDAHLAWRQGMIEFRGQPLSEAIAEFSRYTPVRFVIADPAVARRPIGGSIPAGDVDSLLEALRTNFGLESSRAPDGRIRITAAR